MVSRTAPLSSLRHLELVARTTVEGLRQGLHRSPFHGYSAEFSQYRHYRPGDDLKYVDWKLFARTDRLYTRQFRETTNLSALFVIDASASMNFPPHDRRAMGGPRRSIGSKLDLARTIAAVLGTLVLDQGDAAGVLSVGARTTWVPPRSSLHHHSVMLARLDEITASGEVGMAEGLGRAAMLLKRRGLVIALSDFYDEDASIASLKRLWRMGHDVMAIHTLADEEITLPAAAPAEFEDLETGRAVTVDPLVAREAYGAAVGRWLDRIRRGLSAEGIDYFRVTTADDLEVVLRRFLLARRAAGERQGAGWGTRAAGRSKGPEASSGVGA